MQGEIERNQRVQVRLTGHAKRHSLPPPYLAGLYNSYSTDGTVPLNPVWEALCEDVCGHVAG
eukprot:4227534-Lingulodinium_polyedra.AAC.1